jgi:hypothetical protein
MYQTKIQKLVNGVQSRVSESHGGLKLPQQRGDSMGKDGGPELLQGSDYSDKSQKFDSGRDRKSGHDPPVDKGSEGNANLKNKIAQQWRCPAFAWKALEAMPVRNLFRVSESSKENKPLKDADEAYMKTGDALLSAVEDGGLSEKKLVTIVLAFQRWRHSQLKVSVISLLSQFCFYFLNVFDGLPKHLDWLKKCLLSYVLSLVELFLYVGFRT